MSGFKLQTPVSQLIKTGKGGGGVEERKTRDSHRREKDLEEDRKLGLEPACVDVDTGRDINPHIPQFITQTPWYVPADGPTLKHQRPHWERQQNPDSTVYEWYKRGQQEAPAKRLKFKEGACENCGATTHKKRDCFERPRKVGAKFTNSDIAADDFLQPKLKLTNWEAKRDRWNGYDNAAYTEVIQEHEKQEEVRKMIKAEKLKEEQAAAAAAAKEEEDIAEQERADAAEKEGEDSQGEGEKDEDLYAEDAEMQAKVDMDSTTRMTVRNLRIREDTAKYLLNLNENAPYYDPKSRSMRENPLLGIKGKEQQAAKFSGENFVRYTGEVVAANEAQVFAWSARCQGIDVHALAEPTKLEQLQKDFKAETRDVKQETKKALLEKYGGDEHMQAPPKELLMAQSEAYVEYSRKGAVIKGEERPLVKSRYEEDVYAKNHTSVFGSYWTMGRWGYRCCHSLVRQSYCIGEQGYAVSNEMAALPAMAKRDEKESIKKEDEAKKEAESAEKKEESSSSSSSSSSSDSDSSDDSVDEEEEKERIKKKREEEAAEEKRRAEREARKRERRREKRKRRAEKLGGRRKRKRHNSSSSSSESDSEKEEDNTEDAKLQREVAKALKEEKRARKEAKKNERDRKYNTTYEFKKPSELQTEAYKLTKIHSSDPMAKYMEEKRSV